MSVPTHYPRKLTKAADLLTRRPSRLRRSRRSARVSFCQFAEEGVYARLEIRKGEVGEAGRDLAPPLREHVENGRADLRGIRGIDEQAELAVAQGLAAAVVAAADDGNGAGEGRSEEHT